MSYAKYWWARIQGYQITHGVTKAEYVWASIHWKYVILRGWMDGWMGGIDFWNDASLTHWPLGDFNEILKIMFKLILVTDGCDISSEIAIRWASLDLSDDKSTLVQVMAWCRQATNHYLNQCWARSLPPYGVIRPQWGVFPLAGLLCQLNKWAHQLMILWVLESPLQTCI